MLLTRPLVAATIACFLPEGVTKMLTPAARSGLVVQTWFAIGISPIIVFLTALYVTGKPEPDWLIPLPVTMVIAWHGMRSSLPAFVALLDRAAESGLATRALMIGYGAGLAVSLVAMAAGAMLY
jgi:hypothetical protein